ncbi:hypothetical protein J9317_10220 [Metabacillus sp. KIGAM252]|uniref:Uncharacterized protein n=1 Tax=Metabacillus flavus TaxID=2823519 RepID=A0ABS5LEH5_9BACI|nr:hypothetical protein [Metabacillus flavus]MBS2969137.1 hypothetical protein [Metabacillus flavus]
MCWNQAQRPDLSSILGFKSANPAKRPALSIAIGWSFLFDTQIFSSYKTRNYNLHYAVHIIE